MLRTGPELEYLARRIEKRKQQRFEREKSMLRVIVNALGRELLG